MPPTVTPWRSADGDRRQAQPWRQAQPSRVRSAATVRRGNRADGHAPTVPADRFGQSPRPIFRRSRVRRGDLPTATSSETVPTVTGAPADGHGDRFGRVRRGNSSDGATVTGSETVPTGSENLPRPICRRQQETADGFGRSDLPTVTPWRSSDGDRRQAQPWRQSAATVPRPICRNRSPWQPFRRSRANSPRRQVRTIAAPDLPTVKGSPSRSFAAPSDSLPTGATVPTGSPWRSSDGDRRTRRRSRRENKVCL